MTKILLVGCGKMGSALLAGWLDQGVAATDVVVVDPAASVPGGVRVVGEAAALPAAFVPDIVLLAVKPQMMAAVLGAYAGLAPGAVFLSIAAGKPVAFFQGHLGAAARVVRAMPNTPAAVGRGITVCYAGPGVDGAAQAIAQRLLQAVGEVAWIADEAQMDAVTAVSGSGPAYVFLLAEALAAAGVAAGLSAELSERLARATVSGSGELLRQSEASAGQLRVNVTSPGGTTAAALAVLMDAQGGFGPLLERAVAAAAARGRELAG